MTGTAEIITATAKGAGILAHLGISGFMLFAILTVALMLFFMAFIAYKSITQLIGNHNDNAARIDEAHTRIYTLEQRESDCIKRVQKVTSDLEQCIKDMKNAVK